MPSPIIQRRTLWRSHLRLSHRPTVGLHSICPIINLLQKDSECSMNCVSSPSHESINWVKSSFVRNSVWRITRSMRWNKLCLLHTEVSSALYKFIIHEDAQCNFLATQWTIFGKDVPITDSEVRLMMKHWWSPMPPYCGRMNAFTQVIPGVMKTPSIGALPLWKVGGIGMPVCSLHNSTKFRSSAASLVARRPV